MFCRKDIHSALIVAAVIASLFGPQAMRAQVSGGATVAAELRAQVFLRAQRLVNDGSGAAGRALVDSLLNATDPRSPDEAEVLFWRATLAESWDQAQRDYLRVMLEHERSRFASASMLRLAQGEAMRGDRDAALRYVERLLIEAPNAVERIDALALRVRLTGVAEAPPAQSVPPRPIAPPTVPPAATETTTTRMPVPTPVPAPPVAEARRPAAPSGGMVWSVQIAAFATAREATEFAASVRERGYDARVDGAAAPYRVRFGRYPTRTAAATAMEAYTTKERSDAFLVQVPR